MTGFWLMIYQLRGTANGSCARGSRGDQFVRADDEHGGGRGGREVPGDRSGRDGGRDRGAGGRAQVAWADADGGLVDASALGSRAVVPGARRGAAVRRAGRGPDRRDRTSGHGGGGA